MACSASKTPMFRSVVGRGFATQAHPKTSSGGQSGVQVTTLPTKTLVVSANPNATLSRASVAFRVGTRNESYEQAGLFHALRAATGITNKRSSALSVRMDTLDIGGNFSFALGRENISYDYVVKPDGLTTGLTILQDISSENDFKPWVVRNEVIDHGALKYVGIGDDILKHLSHLTREERALNQLHAAAYQTSIGNSLYCEQSKAKKIKNTHLQEFTAKYLTSDRCVVVGVGIDHQLLVGYAHSLSLVAGQPVTTPPSKFTGGQLRVEEAGDLATVAIATQGAASSNRKEALAFAILQSIADDDKSVNGSFIKAVGNSLSKPLKLNPLNLSYSDTGLFGVLLTAKGNEIGKAVGAISKVLRTGSVSSADVARGKNVLKANVSYRLSTTEGALESLRSQALQGEEILVEQDLIAAIDAVSEADVNAAAKKVASGKWAIGAVGNLGTLPNATDL